MIRSSTEIKIVGLIVAVGAPIVLAAPAFAAGVTLRKSRASYAMSLKLSQVWLVLSRPAFLLLAVSPTLLARAILSSSTKQSVH